jgi:hypothetical protein
MRRSDAPYPQSRLTDGDDDLGLGCVVTTTGVGVGVCGGGVGVCGAGCCGGGVCVCGGDDDLPLRPLLTFLDDLDHRNVDPAVGGPLDVVIPAASSSMSVTAITTHPTAKIDASKKR